MTIITHLVGLNRDTCRIEARMAYSLYSNQTETFSLSQQAEPEDFLSYPTPLSKTESARARHSRIPDSEGNTWQMHCFVWNIQEN
jgi:hypothetical protein